MKKVFESVRNRGFLLFAGCIVVLAWNMALSTSRKNSSGTLERAKQEDLVIQIAAPGKIEPKFEETIRAEIDGKKKAVLVNEGDTVKKGDLLIEISDERIRLDVSQKKIAFQNAQSDMVKSKRDYQLEKSLFKQQAVPEREVESARLTYEKAVQTYDTALQEYKLIEQKAKGVRVVSPMDGIVLKIFVDKEDWITAGKELVKVAKLESYVVRGRVDELDIANIATGQDVVIKCDAFPTIIFPGKVARIGAQAADGAFAEIEVTIDILDEKGVKLKPGLTAEASIVTGDLKGATLIPARAVRQDSEGAYVLKAGTGGWLKRQPVEIAQVSAGLAAVKSGVLPGEAVIVPEEK